MTYNEIADLVVGTPWSSWSDLNESEYNDPLDDWDYFPDDEQPTLDLWEESL